MIEKKQLNRTEQIELAAKLLGMEENEAANNSSPLLDTKALYCYSSRRGGGAIIIDVDGSFLYAASFISPEKHIKEYLSGRRSEIKN